MNFERLALNQWRQINNIDIAFHPRLTVLTGANGAGKTTILQILAQHMRWDFHYLATPIADGDSLSERTFRLVVDMWHRAMQVVAPDDAVIGSISYSNGRRSALRLPKNINQQYVVEIPERQDVTGIFVASHRPMYVYERVTEIPTEVTARGQLLNVYSEAERTRHVSGRIDRSPSYHLKRSLISLATFGPGNEYVQADSQAMMTLIGFQDVLRKILPSSLGFRRLEVRMPEVVLMTDTGDFPIDSVSGGLAALTDLAWQIYLQTQIDEEAVILIDEPETHLHPELQRTVLPNLLAAFPEAQFVVSTHNPLVVGSVPDSNVYVLRFVDGSVESGRLDMVNMARSSNEILREVLGLDNALPVWVERAIDELATKYSRLPITSESLTELRAELEKLGLGALLPQAMDSLLKSSDTNNQD
ncbi:MAG TPA: AAA family ATPase [Dehalococcoidia bacterium]|nr:AAA family ATPase [Dehalococcoidia bacterium]